MYYLILFLGLISSLLKKSRVRYMLFVLVILILAYFRYGVGPDYFSYNFLFSRLSDNVVYEFLYGIDSQEIGFRLIGSFLKKIGINYQQYIAIFATINIYFISKTIKKYSKKPILSMTLYYCFYYFVWTFSGIRQGVTLAIGIYFLLQCIENNNAVKIFIVTIILASIHITSIILIPLYYLSKIKLTRNQLVVISSLSILVGMIPLGNVLSKLQWITLINRASIYWDHSSGIINIFDFQTLGRLFFLTVALFYYDEYSKESDISNKIIKIYILSLSIYFVLKFSEGTASRISLYGKVLDIIILTNIYYLYKNKANKFIFVALLTLISLLYFNKELYNMHKVADVKTQLGPSNIIPYTNIFNENNYDFNNRYYFYLND